MQVQTKSFVCQETLLQPHLWQGDAWPGVLHHQVVHGDHDQGQQATAAPGWQRVQDELDQSWTLSWDLEPRLNPYNL